MTQKSVIESSKWHTCFLLPIRNNLTQNFFYCGIEVVRKENLRRCEVEWKEMSSATLAASSFMLLFVGWLKEGLWSKQPMWLKLNFINRLLISQLFMSIKIEIRGTPPRTKIAFRNLVWSTVPIMKYFVFSSCPTQIQPSPLVSTCYKTQLQLVCAQFHPCTSGNLKVC